MSARLSLCLLILLLGAGVACGSSGGGQAAASPSASAVVSTNPHDKLAAPAATPAGFPGDVPVYPGARLTAGAAFSGGGQTTFGMEWETLDSVDKVHTFYATKLNQGDWTISFSGTTASSFNAVFSRKSNSKVVGTIGADGSSGVSKISLSLVSSGQ
ncbi:MAG TPA: hypothetical protein VJT78_09640 [Candidatus Dormibacteraeota bacterium]|nr:hypothetical protein [Candidatus Dormibacteraeota bacterium]